MRPPEIDATFVLTTLRIDDTEDSGGDMPYLWVLGFKIDADNLQPGPNPLIPQLSVTTTVGAPSVPWIAGSDEIGTGPHPIQAALGTRGFRLRPGRLPIGGWFEGFGGIVCLAWEQDAFDPSTSEAGHKAFNSVFGKALATELTVMLNGDPGYDAALNLDAGGNQLPVPPDFGLAQRVERLSDPIGIRNVTRELKGRVADAVTGPIKRALSEAAGWLEVLDPDDLIGVDAAVFTTRQLLSMQSITLRFTDDPDADYTATGFALGSRVHHHQLASSVLSIVRTEAEASLVKAKVCWFAERLYTATAYRQVTTTRFRVVSLDDRQPTAVRWLVDSRPLEGVSGSIGVTLDPVGSITGSAAQGVASHYPGGPGTLSYTIGGLTLDLTNTAGDGVFHGTVHAVVAYQGDPPLTEHARPLSGPELVDRGYALSEDLSILTVEVHMDDQYVADMARCMRTVKDIDRKHLPMNFGKARFDPGDPHPHWSSLQELLRQEAAIENLVGVRIPGLHAGERVGTGQDGTGRDGTEPAATAAVEQRLRTLQRLLDDGLVTAEEFRATRAAVIAQV